MTETVASLKKEVSKLKKANSSATKKYEELLSKHNSEKKRVKAKVEEIFLDDLFHWTEFKADPDDVLNKLFRG